MNENNEAIAKYYIEHPDLLASLLDEINNQAGILINRTPIKILIDVQGGLVQEVFSNNPDVEISLIDWDNIKEGGDTEFVTSDNYGAMLVTDEQLEEKMAEANKVIQENIDWNKENN